MKFMLVMRDCYAKVHHASWNLPVVPQIGAEIELPDIEGRTTWLTVMRHQHQIDGTIRLWLDTEKFPPEVIEDLVREIKDEVIIG